MSFCVSVTGMYPAGFDYMAPPPPYPGPPQNWAAPPPNWAATAPPPPPGPCLSLSLLLLFFLFISPPCMSVSPHTSDLIYQPRSESLQIMQPKKGVLMSHQLNIKLTQGKHSPLPLLSSAHFWHLVGFGVSLRTRGELSTLSRNVSLAHLSLRKSLSRTLASVRPRGAPVDSVAEIPGAVRCRVLYD